MGDLRPVGGAAEMGHRYYTERASTVERKRRRESPIGLRGILSVMQASLIRRQNARAS
jgi:hypothetical protein